MGEGVNWIQSNFHAPTCYSGLVSCTKIVLWTGPILSPREATESLGSLVILSLRPAKLYLEALHCCRWAMGLLKLRTVWNCSSWPGLDFKVGLQGRNREYLAAHIWGVCYCTLPVCGPGLEVLGPSLSNCCCSGQWESVSVIVTPSHIVLTGWVQPYQSLQYGVYTVL